MDALHQVVAQPISAEGRRPSPLLVLLHGYGSNEQDLMGLVPYLDPRFRTISLRAPLALDFGGFAWFPIKVGPAGVRLSFDQAYRARAQLQRQVGELKEQHDAETVLLLGFSQGASMALSAVLDQPGLCDGVAFLSGICVPEMLPERKGEGSVLDGLPVLMTHGKQDQLIPIEQGRTSRDLLRELPLNLDFVEYEMGHEINQTCLQRVAEWLTCRIESAASDSASTS